MNMRNAAVWAMRDEMQFTDVSSCHRIISSTQWMRTNEFHVRCCCCCRFVTLNKAWRIVCACVLFPLCATLECFASCRITCANWMLSKLDDCAIVICVAQSTRRNGYAWRNSMENHKNTILSTVYLASIGWHRINFQFIFQEAQVNWISLKTREFVDRMSSTLIVIGFLTSAVIFPCFALEYGTMGTIHRMIK